MKGKEVDLLLVDPGSDIYINLPNLSLVYAATICSAPVVDQHVLAYPKDRFMKYNARVLGISIRSFAFREAKRIASKYRGRYPQSAVKSVSTLDVQCCYPFLELEERMDVAVQFSDALPFPQFELCDSFNYLRTNWQVGLWHYPLLTSLGCPFQCIFCASRNREYKKRSVDNCVEELRRAKRDYGIVSFEIIDDVFNLQKERVLEFCDKVSGMGLGWLCSNGLRADRFDEEQAKALKGAGCRAVGFGIESCSDKLLSAIKKGESAFQIESAVNIARKYFSEVKGYFIIGLPGSDFNTDMQSISWAIKLGIKPVVSYYVPDTAAVEQDAVFYGSAAIPRSDAYAKEEQKRVYAFAKKQLKIFYGKQGLVFRMIMLTFKALRRYDFNSLLTHFTIGPRRLFKIIMRGEVQ